MVVNFPISAELEMRLRHQIPGDLSVYALEALATQLYRDRRLTHGQLEALLGVGSYDADAVLKRNGGVDEISGAELETQLDASMRIRAAWLKAK